MEEQNATIEPKSDFRKQPRKRLSGLDEIIVKKTVLENTKHKKCMLPDADIVAIATQRTGKQVSIHTVTKIRRDAGIDVFRKSYVERPKEKKAKKGKMVRGSYNKNPELAKMVKDIRYLLKKMAKKMHAI